MRNLTRLFVMTILISMLLVGTVYAAEDKYIVTKEMIYESIGKNRVSSGFVEILIGNMNFTEYQKDNEIIITPTPDEIITDEYGNMYAKFDVSGLLSTQKFRVTIKRDCETTTYEKLIPERTNTIINNETSIFLEPKEKIESDDPELISKAKEITEGLYTDYKKAQAIFEYVNVNMSYDESSSHANKGALAALTSMRGVCYEFSTLFAAMCRAVDVPCRVIEGYKVEPALNASGDILENQYTLVNHLWAEIYLEEIGWAPVEPTYIYTVNGERKPHFDSFCRIDTTDYVAVGIYNYEKANRRMRGVEETSYEEKVVAKSTIAPEVQNTFADTNSVAWAKDAIQSLYAKNIVNGYSATVYGPENNISRIEFMCMLSRMLRYNETAYVQDKGMSYYYSDYDTNHWSVEDYDFLMRCYQAINPGDKSSMGFEELTDVFGVGSLKMDKAITRAEVVALMHEFMEDGYETTSFTDVSIFTPFYSSIMKASSIGLIVGYPDGTFRPNAPITRAEMAVVLNRYLTNNNYTLVVE
ncbi:MAG: S-layer homology domain-containing protein [Clostridia bacterium]|nr:S-layer homology domain-containing protein [Clostridia bacterium]